MPADLLERCAAAKADGADFPTIWHTILRRDPRVAGSPIQMTDGEHTWLEVPLTSGHRLKHDPDDGFQLLDLVSSLLRDQRSAP